MKTEDEFNEQFYSPPVWVLYLFVFGFMASFWGFVWWVVA